MEVVGGALVALMVGFVIMCVLNGRKRWERSKDPLTSETPKTICVLNQNNSRLKYP
jgi:hypothetical protein